MKNIKELIKGNTVKFQYYRKGNLWYALDDFLFPVPIEDTGDGEFKFEDKAIYFMRYIRKYMKEIEKEVV